MRCLACFDTFCPQKPGYEMRFLGYFSLVSERLPLKDIIISIDSNSHQAVNNFIISREKTFKAVLPIDPAIKFKTGRNSGDVIGYQTLLKYLKNNINILDNYDIVYFLHTHCITHSHYWRVLGGQWCFRQVMYENQDLFQIPEIGSIGVNYDLNNSEKTQEYFDTLDKFGSFPCKSINYSVTRSISAYRANIIKMFLENLKDDSIFCNLEDQGYQRNFFEFWWSSICSKFGYINFANGIDFPCGITLEDGKKEIIKCYEKYVEINNLKERFKNFNIEQILRRIR